METDFNKRVRKVLINSALIVSVSIVTYLLYSTIEKTKTIAEKDKRILVDSLTIVSKIRELKVLKTSYEKLEVERDLLGLLNDSLESTVSILSGYIKEVELKDSMNLSKLALLDKAIKNATQKLKKEKETFSLIEKNNKVTLSKSSSGQPTEAYLHDHTENFEVNVTKMELEPVDRSGKVLSTNNSVYDKVKFIRIKFIIMKNKLTSPVQKIFSVQLIEPDGRPYKFDPQYDFIMIDRNKIHLTNKKKIEFDGNDTPVVFFYPKATSYKPGENKIQLFYENKLIAEKSIVIK